MAWTDADKTALDAAIAQGVLRVDYADRSVTYRSLDEMLKLRALMSGEQAAAAGTARPKIYLASSGKGL